MIDRFVRALRGAGLDLEPLQISELLWIATQLPTLAPGDDGPAPDHGGTPGDGPPHVPGDLSVPSDQIEATTLDEESTLRASVFADVREARASDSGSRARAVALPAFDVMPDRQRLRRALRPFGRKRRSEWRRVFDEIATADRCAENDGLLIPVYRPTLERWFEVMLVVERVASMQFWADRINVFAALLEDRGGFREVRRFSLDADADGFTVINPQGARSPADRLGTTGRRSLVLLVSDGTSPAWRSGVLPALLHTWAVGMSVAVVNPLPEALWTRTWIGAADATVATIVPGPRNAQLLINPPWWDFEPLAGRLAVPVIGLEPISVERWARTIMAAGGAEARAVLVSPRLPVGPPAGGSASDAGPDPSERLARFTRHASKPARLLAAYLSAAPLTLPVMRLVQHAMLPSSSPTHLAEVFLGGLIERVTPAGAAAAPDRVQYDFVDDLRERLQEGLFGGEAIRILSLVANLLDRLSGEPGRHTTFSALVADAEGNERLPDDAMPLASVSRPLLARLGYAPAPGSVTVPAEPEAQGRDIRLPVEATFTHSAPQAQLSWSFDSQRLAILHGNGLSVAAMSGGSWQVDDHFVNDLAWLSRPRYRMVVIAEPLLHAPVPNDPDRSDDLRALLIDPLLEALAEALRDGGRRVVTLVAGPESADWQTVAGDPAIPIVVFSKGGLEKGLGILGRLGTNPTPGVIAPLAVLLPDAGTDAGGLRSRVGGDLHVLDCSVIATDQEWRRRRIASDLGDVAVTMRKALHDRELPIGAGEKRRWTACTWLPQDRLAVGWAQWPEDLGRIVAFNANQPGAALEERVETFWQTERPVVSLAGLGDHESYNLVCGASANGEVVTAIVKSGLGQIQEGLGLPRRVAASASGAAFAYTDNGSGVLAWGPDFERTRINGGRDTSVGNDLAPGAEARSIRKYPVRVVGCSFVEGGQASSPRSSDIRLDVFWSTGHCETFSLRGGPNVASEPGPTPEASWNVGERIFAGATSPDGRHVVVVGASKLTVWDSERRQTLATLELPDLRESPAVSFSRDSRYLAVSAGPTTRVFSTSSLAGISTEDGRTAVDDAPAPTTAQSEPHLTGFTYDVYISYAHLDNQPLTASDKGWVTDLQRALKVRLAQLTGSELRVWMDSNPLARLQDQTMPQVDDSWSDHVLEALHRSAVFVPIVSPGYVRSEWALRELREFWNAADEQGGVRVRDRSRIFKVIKTPVTLERQPEQLQSLLGYEFFKIEPTTGRVRQLDPIFGEAAEKDFWLKLDDLAHDIANLLHQLRPDPGSAGRSSATGLA